MPVSARVTAEEEEWDGCVARIVGRGAVAVEDGELVAMVAQSHSPRADRVSRGRLQGRTWERRGPPRLLAEDGAFRPDLMN